MSGPSKHDLDYTKIDDVDETIGDEQFALVWCNTHQKHEWHWIARSLVTLSKMPSRMPR